MDNNLSVLKQLILDKTQGTPFFMEEIVQELREQGVLADVGARRAVPLPTDLHLPPTVQGILAARIDRLAPDEKALLQQLSVIGREFPLSLIRQVITQPEGDLYRILASLQRKEFLYEQPAFPEVEYIFKHALTQEVAYGTVLHEQRKVLHEQTGQAMELLYASNLDEHYSDLAHHYRRSANTEKAITYLQLAGQQAARQAAPADAINHLTSALALLKTLPDTPERNQRELTLHVALGAPLTATTSYAAPEVGNVYRQAQELCAQVGDTSEIFPTLWGLMAFHLVRAEHKRAHELAEQLLHLAQSKQDSALLLVAHLLLGLTLSCLGELVPARAHLEQGIALYDSSHHQSLAFSYSPLDPAVNCLSHVALVLWRLGYPEQALKRSHEALTLSQERSHPTSLALALDWAAMLHQYRCEWQLTQERAETAMTLCTEQGFSLWLAWGTILGGWVLAEQGQGEEGIAQMRQGLAAYQATGSEFTRAYFLSLLAEAYGRGGQVDDGLAAIAEALQLVDKNDERIYEAELYRLRGELTLQQAGSRSRVGITHHDVMVAEAGTVGRAHPTGGAEAEACFLKAIEISTKQQAKSLELRAVMSLARLWQQQGKSAEARRMLAEIYGWFTEGFDTKDLQEAKGLLEELTG